MAKVTMSLTDRDVTNTVKIEKLLHARSKAHAVSIALSLTAFVVDQMHDYKNELLLRSPDGDLQRIVMTELAPISP
jgi:hypothetical protein